MLLTVEGSRRVSRAKLAAVSVYHALIFHGESHVISVGGGFLNDGPLSTVTVSWTVQTNPPDDYKNVEKRQVTIGFHVLDKTVRVGSERFPLSKGNLFVIHLDRGRLQASTQIPTHLAEPAERRKVLDSFKSASPSDESIQKLELPEEVGALSNCIRPAPGNQVSQQAPSPPSPNRPRGARLNTLRRRSEPFGGVLT